jgi:chemotaxis receptor (MCP) glutamine deamidase CheD
MKLLNMLTTQYSKMLASLHRLNIKLFGAYNLLSYFQLAELFSTNALGVPKQRGSYR